MNKIEAWLLTIGGAVLFLCSSSLLWASFYSLGIFALLVGSTSLILISLIIFSAGANKLKRIQSGEMPTTGLNVYQVIMRICMVLFVLLFVATLALYAVSYLRYSQNQPVMLGPR